MLVNPDSHLFIYPISRDFGFAPNPFHSVCTLATCKPRIRKSALVNDWVLGIAGTALRSVSGKGIFLMKVTEKLSFDDYWNDQRFSLKRPVRNGSRVQMLGDNIYHRNDQGEWEQEDSHHSNPDGTINEYNLSRDTGRCEQVLTSNKFCYFGSAAIEIDLETVNYGRVRDYRKYNLSECDAAKKLIIDIVSKYRGNLNYIHADPCQYKLSHKRANQETGKVA